MNLEPTQKPEQLKFNENDEEMNVTTIALGVPLFCGIDCTLIRFDKY